MKNSRVCLFGGSFSPIHKGHIYFAQLVLKRYKYDRVIFIPARTPPHKSDTGIISGSIRLKMIGIALKGKKGLTFSDYELKNRVVSYSIRTIKYFLKRYSDISILIGMDQCLVFQTWKNYRQILEKVNVLVLPRRGYFKKEIREDLRASFTYVVAKKFTVSSTGIREMIANGKDARKYLNRDIYEFIKKQKLYI